MSLGHSAPNEIFVLAKDSGRSSVLRGLFVLGSLFVWRCL